MSRRSRGPPLRKSVLSGLRRYIFLYLARSKGEKIRERTQAYDDEFDNERSKELSLLRLVGDGIRSDERNARND